MFVNRVSELDALRRWWAGDSARAAMVWGRRRVGKTALLQHFAADLPAVFHTGAGRARADELVQLSRQVRAGTPSGMRDLERRPYADWDDALEDLALRAVERPLLVVLDEFPELVVTSPDLPGILRAFLDRVAGRTQLRLLLCGSAVRVMTALAEERAPLYGRFDLALQLHPFTPAESALLLPGLAAPDRALVHGLLGGMPLYLSWWDAAADVRENLSRLVCRPGAPLLTEGQLVLATEADAGEHPAAALYAIANGRTRYSEIRDALGSEPSRTLDRLTALRLVERAVPVTDPERTRNRRYRIADNFLAFYLSVLSRYRAEIDRGLGPAILDVVLASLDDHMGPVWEATVRDHVRAVAARREWPRGALLQADDDVVAVGSWWAPDSSAEIDVVALAGRVRRPVLAGEVKWTRSVDGRRLARDLGRAVDTMMARSGGGPTEADEVATFVAAREEVRDVPPGVGVVTATDVFGP